MALTPRQKYVMRGHPTSPGVRDFPGTSLTAATPVVEGNLSRLQQGSDKYTKDGKPGIPRYIAPYPRDMHADPASLIGGAGKGPKQPGVHYVGERPPRDPWNALNERLRLAAIAAAQSGGNT